MGWRLKGRYVGTCSCSMACACATGRKPTGPGDVCRGAAVWDIQEGHFDDTDLSGLSYGLTYFMPSDFVAGGVKMGVYVDSRASEEQERALMAILSGQAGGPFADMVALASEVTGPERAEIRFAGGEAPRASIAGVGEVGLELLMGEAAATPSPSRSAMFGSAPALGFAPELGLARELRIGQGTGSATGFGGEPYDPVYAEAAEYEYTGD